MARNRTPRFMNLFSPERRSARTDRWRKRFRKFSLSSWHSTRIVETVCSVFRSGAEAARAVSAATGTQMVSALSSRSLRLEGLESRQMLSAVPLTGGTYTQDFDTLDSTTSNSSPLSPLPSGWLFSESGTGANTTYGVNFGTNSAGNTYSYGGDGSSDRALGSLQSGSVIPTIGASFQNNTSGGIESVAISYTGEQWRLGSSGRVDRLDFQYSLDATSLITGVWTNVDDLDFTAPVTGPTIGALNGNAEANRTSVSGTISGLSIPVGGTIFIRWNDLNATNADDGLAIDDFSMTSTAANARPTANSQTLETDEDVELTGQVSGADAEGVTLTFAPATNPQHGTLVLDATSGEFTYTPVGDYNGPDSFTFTASDGALTSLPATVSITVNSMNDAPTLALPASVTVAENIEVFLDNLSSLVSDVETAAGDVTFTISGPDAARGGWFEAGNALRFLDPLPDFETPGSAAGTNVYEFLVTAHDANGGSSAAMPISVTVTDILEVAIPVSAAINTTTGDLEVAVQDGQNHNLALEIVTAPGGGGPHVKVFDGANPLGEFLLADITGTIVVTGGSGSDTLRATATFSDGSSADVTNISFDGGGGFDTLDLSINFAKVTYKYDDPSSGEITFSDLSAPGGGSITYTNIEPIVNSGNATDMEFVLTAGADDATLAHLGGGLYRLSGASFEDTDFMLPTGSLTISGDGDDDMLTVIDAIAVPSLTFDFETINVGANLSGTLAGGANTTVVNVLDDDAEIADAIELVAALGTVNVAAGTYVGAVNIAKDVTIDGAGDSLVTIDANNANTGIDVQSGNTVSIDGVTVSNFSSTGVRVQGDLTLTNSTVDGGLVGVWADGGTLDMQSSIITNAVIFGVQVGAGGDADISTSEISGTGSTAAGVVVSDGHADVVASKLSGNSRGLLVNATGTATVTLSDLSGNTNGGVVNATATVVDASGNWWGSTNENDVDNAATGAVDFTPFLNAGDTNGAVRGVQASKTLLNVTTLGDQIGSTGRIQEGVNLVDVSGAISVRDGVYDETVLVDKTATLQSTNQHGAQIAPTTGSQQTVVRIDAEDVIVDGFAIQVNQNDDGALLGTAPIAPVGIGAVGTLMDGLLLSDNMITSIGSNAVNWTGAPGLTVRAAGIVLNDAPSGNIPSVTLTNNDVSILSGTSFFQRAVWLSQLNADITGNTLAGFANDLIFQFASGGPSLIQSNNFVGVHSLGGSGVVIADPNSGSPIDIIANTFTALPTFPSSSLQVNRNVNGATSPINIQSNIFSGYTAAGVDVGGAGGVSVSGNTFTPKAGAVGFVSVVVDSQNASNNASTASPVDTQVFGNTFNTNGGTGTAILAENNLVGATYATGGVQVGVGGANIYNGAHTTGVRVLGGVATVTDNIVGAGTGLSVSGGTATLAGGTLVNNATGVSVSGAGALTVGAGNAISGATTGVLLSGSGVGLTGLTFNDMSIDATGDYITLASGAFDDLELDATDMTLGGVDVDMMTPAQLFAASNKITDEIDDNALGLVVLVTNTIFVTPVGLGAATATDNDYTRIANALGAANAGDTILLGANGGDAIFNWNEANALASWELGNDATASTDDDWGAMLPAGLNNVTITAALLDEITIQGPGDLSTTALETGFLAFGNGTNTDWTFSNFNIFGIDNAIGLYYSGADDYSGLTIDSMHISVPADNDVEPSDFQNIGIHYGFGQNITISNNKIDIDASVPLGSGTGTSTVGIQSNTHGGTSYEGLAITGNIITVTGSGASIVGIWENGHAHLSNIEVSGNFFYGDGDPTTNDQTAFLITSHSGATSVVEYSGNTIDNAAVGFEWLDEYQSTPIDYTGTQAVQLIGNDLSDVNTGVSIGGINASALLSDNTLTNSGAMAGVGVGVDVLAGASATVDDSIDDNTITGFATGIRSAGTVIVDGNDASIYGNAVGVDVTAGTATISNNHIYDNTIGVRFATTGGGSLTNNNFDSSVDDNATDLVIAATAGAVTIGAGNDFAGDTFFIDNQSTQSYDLSANGTTFDETNNFRIEDKVFHPLDAGNTSAGLVTWVADNVFVTAPGVSTDSSIQRGVDAVPLLPGWTVNVEAGVYVENVSINKNLTLLSELGRASATIQGVSGVGALGAIVVTGGTTDVNIGGPAGNGFTIVGVDNGLPGIENAAVYFQGSHSGADVRFNDVVANGDAGLMTESGQTITNFNIDNNIFSGQTFIGTPADLGFANQFTTPNVPRQLVVMGSGPGNTLMTNLQFTNNQITGTAGGINGALQEQGNTLVTVDGLNTTISDNTFSGTTTRFGHSLRARGANNTITDNVFNSATMGASTVDVYVNRTGNVIQGNTFTSSAGAAIHVDNLGGATIGGAGLGQANSISGYASGILVTGASASAVIDSNSITSSGAGVGVNVIAGTTLIQNNTLTGNLVGIRASSGAIVDAGSALADGNPTGLGVSTGGNILTGYTGTGGNYAIEDLNLAAQSDVYAKFNDFGPYVAISIIENYVFDDTDDPTRSMVLFAGALNQQPAPSVVYVDDSWAGTALGADADGAGNAVPNWTGIGGNANGTQFGVDQFATIQDAINAVAATGSIYVYDGLYVQELVIDQALSLFGFQAGQNATTRGVGAESIIEASATSDALIEVNASNVTIDGFTVDGADDAFRAIRVNGVDLATVQNNIITGAVRGVQYNGAAAGNTGGVIAQNLIEDLTVGAGDTYGVLAFDASYASVTNNVITADAGVFEQYFYQPNGGGNAANVISGNVINAALVGYGTNERSAAAASTSLSGNTYNMSGGTGVQLYNIYKTGGVTLTNETIVGADVGVYAFVNGGSVSITGGSITGTDASGSIGVHVTNYLTDFSYAATANGDVTIDGVDVSDFGVGVHVEDDALGAFAVHATITNDTDITSSGTAVLVSGADASVDVTNNDNSISGNAVGIDVNGGSATVSNNHIFDNGVGVQFRNGGTGSLTNNNFDDAADNDTDVLVQASAGAVTLGDGNDFAGDDYYIENLSTQGFNLVPLTLTTYEGSIPGAFPDNFRIEDQMLHGPDNGTSGVVTWVAGELFVTTNGTGANDETIQNAINVADADDTISIEAGSYSENLAIGKDINLVGVGSVTLSPAAGGNLVTIDGSGFGDDQSVSLANIDFNGSTGLAGYGIRVNSTASFNNLTVTDSSFTGFNFNAIAVFGNATTGISVQDVDVTNSTFVDNGIAGGGGSGDLQFFEYNGSATLANLDLSNTGAGADAHLGIQFRGVGLQNGTGVLPMGAISLTDVDISGLYVRQMIGLQRYDTAGISFSDVRLGGVGSAITGTFGAALRIDAVGDGTFASSTTIDLGDTYFRGVGGLGLDIEIAPDGFGFLRADATDTRWNTTLSTDVTPDELGVTLAELFEIENRILHFVDGTHPNPLFGTFDGFVETIDGNAYITTTQNGNIQRGVDVVDLLGTVNVAAGTYTQTVSVGRTVTLEGAGKGVDARTRAIAETIVNGPSATATIAISADNVVLDGFTVSDNTAGSGVFISSAASGHQILNNIVEDNVFGLYLNSNGATPTVVERNLFQNNDASGAASGNGVYSDQGLSNVTIEDNKFAGNNFNAGVILLGLPAIPITGATIRGNQFVDGNQAVIFNADGALIDDNDFSGSLPSPNTDFTGTAVFVGGGSDGVQITDNTFTDRGWRAISVVDAGFGYGANSNVTITGNTIAQNVAALTASDPQTGLALISLADVGGASLVDDNDITITGTMVDDVITPGVTFLHGIAVAGGGAGGTVTVSNNALDGNDADLGSTVDDSIGIRLTAEADVRVLSNGVTGFVVGVDVDDATALVESSDLNGNTIGVRIQNGGVADLGQVGPGVDFTGLGVSTGGNDFSGYLAAATAASGAIVNLNTGGDYSNAGPQGFAGPEFDVAAFNNLWALPTNAASIENVIWHDADDVNVGFIDYASLNSLMVSLEPLPSAVTNEPVNEGSSTTVYGQFVNDAQSHQVTITWGDGSPNTVVILAAGVTTFAIASPAATYTDDPNGPVQTILRNISVTVEEVATPTNSLADNSLSVNVNNVIPDAALSTPDGDLNEGETLTLDVGPAVDPGADTVQSYRINWGDGTFDVIVGNLSTIATHTHQYLDGLASPNVTVTLDLFDDDGTWNTVESLNILVHNVAPTAGGFFSFDAAVNEGSTTTVFFVGPFTDPGSPDSPFRFAYDFNGNGIYGEAGELGDGTYAGSVAASSATVPAQFLADDDDSPRTVKARIIDNDGGFTEYMASIVINNVAPVVNAGADSIALAGVPFMHTVTFTDPGADAPWTVNVDWNGDGDFLDADEAAFGVGGHSFTISHTYSVGEIGNIYNVKVQVDDNDGGVDDDVFQVTVVENTFRVTNFVTYDSGFDVTFNQAADLGVLNLYSGQGGPVTPPDVTLVGANVGAVKGSIIWNPTTNTLSFVKTGGVLAADTYTVTLVSGDTAFQNTLGSDLDGDGNFTPGGDYANAFSVTSSGERIVSVQDFARGAGQDVDLPIGTSPDFHIRIDNAAGVTAVDVDVVYDPALLNITGAFAASGLPGGWSITTNFVSPGLLKLTLSGTAPLVGSNLNLIRLVADVPATAPYGASQVVRLEGLRVNEDALASKADYAVHKAVYVGDADGDGQYLGVDASRISRVVVNLDSGFSAHPWTDPLIVADASGDGTLSGQDASLVAQEAALIDTPEIPPLPGIVLIPAMGGIDPELSVPTQFAAAGDTVAIPVRINVLAPEASDPTVVSATFDVFFNNAALSLGVADIAQGSFWTVGDNWSLTKNVVGGQARLVFFNSDGGQSLPGVGDIAYLTFTLDAGLTPGQVVPLDIQPVSATEGGLTWTNSDGAIGVTYTADFDLDGDVDGDDLGDWQTGFGTSPNATVGQGDEDRDGDVDGSDFLAWQRQLGSTVIATVATVGNSAPTSSFSALSAEAAAVSADAVAESMESESSTSQTASWWLESPSISHRRSESPAESRDADAAFHDWSAHYDSAASAVAVVNAEDDSDEFAAIENLYQDQDDSESFGNEFDEALLSWLEG